MNNYEVLKNIVEEKAVIRHVSKHRNPDGSMDIAGILFLLLSDLLFSFSFIVLFFLTQIFTLISPDDRYSVFQYL